MKPITIEEYNKLAEKLDQNHFLHGEDWSNVREKMGWECELVGLEQDGKLVAAAFLHSKPLPKIKYKMYYVPRGYVIDYNNQELLKEFTKSLKKYLKKKKAFVVRIDPDVKRYDVDTDYNPLSEETMVIDNLKNAGYKHRGFLDNYEGTQPRHTFRIDLTKDIKTIKSNLHPRVKSAINTANKKGIEIVDGTKADLQEFERIMQETGSRGGYITRSTEFFELILDEYQTENIEFKFARLNTKKLAEQIINTNNEAQVEQMKLEMSLADESVKGKKRKKLENQQKDLQFRIDKVKKEEAEIKMLQEKYPDGINLAASFFVTEGDKNWYWFSGSSNTLREYNPVYKMLWDHILECKEKNMKFFDMFGVSGKVDKENKNYGLYQFKKGFGGELHEFIGEFDLILNKPVYQLAIKILEQAQSSNDNKALQNILKIIRR